MELYINGHRADGLLDIGGLTIMDNAAGKADTMTLQLNAGEDGAFISAVQTDDEVVITQDGFTSGVMFESHIFLQGVWRGYIFLCH